MGGILFGKARALDDLHLVNLQDVDGQFGDERCLSERLLCVLSGQSQDDVRTCEYSSVVGTQDGIAAARRSHGLG